MSRSVKIQLKAMNKALSDVAKLECEQNGLNSSNTNKVLLDVDNSKTYNTLEVMRTGGLYNQMNKYSKITSSKIKDIKKEAEMVNNN